METICRRCLEREPRRRYASAEAVAEELESWLNGEPISARPVGKLERSWMWCRRNRLVAGLTASVAVVLILSTAVSTVFAVRESNRPRAERTERIRAEYAEKDTRKARDEIEGTFTRSLIQPLDPASDAKDVLGQFEVEALWELAGYGVESLGLRLVDEATRGPTTTRQLCARSEPALIAAVGLDQNKREQAIDLLMKRLAEPGLPPAQRADIALIAMELTDRPGPETRACEEALAAAIKADLPARPLAAWTKHFSRDVDRFDPDAGARLILLALHKETGATELGNLSLALARVASRLKPARAGGVCGEALRFLTDAPVNEKSDKGRRELARGFAALAVRLPRDEAIRSLTAALGRVADSGAKQRLAAGLRAVINAMSPDDDAAIFPTAALSLADALSREADNDNLASGLATLAKAWRAPNPSDVGPVVQSLATALKAEKDPARRGRLAWALAPLADRLSEEESTRICLAAAESLSSDWTKTNKLEPDQGWIRGLAEMTIRVPKDIATRAARLVATIAESAPNSGQNLYRVLDGLDADDAARTAPVLVAALGQENDPSIRWWLGAGLCMAAEKMDPEKAARLCGPVVEDMGKAVTAEKGSLNWHFWAHRINGFAVVASRQTPAVACRSAHILADVLKIEGRSDVGIALAKGLAALAGRMEPVEAERICGEAAHVLADCLKVHEEPGCATGLALLASRMNPGEAERIRGEAARNLSNVLGRDRYLSPYLSYYRAHPETLAAVAAGMEPVEAVRMLAELLGREIDDTARIGLAKGLSATTARMEPAAADRVCDTTIRALLRDRLARPRDAWSRRGFDSAVGELLPRLEPRKANAQAAILAAMMCSEGIDAGDGPRILSRLLTDTSQTQRDLRAVRTAMRTVGPGEGALAAVASLEAKPWPCRLSAQELVDLLKMPTCFGTARRVVLDELGNIHGRQFANHWEFVRFAQENNLSLDLTTPPSRPDPSAFGADEG